MYGLYLIGVMVVTGGVIAFIGDKIGTKIGKKRLSIFGLRPRHTSMIITVLTGIFITAASIGVMAITSENVRTALFGMEKLNATMASTKQAVEALAVELLQSQEEYRAAESNLKNSRKEIADLKAEQENLTAESENLKNGIAQLESEKEALTSQNETLSASNSKLDESNKKLSEDNSQLEEHAKNLREGLIAIREGDIAFRAGEILATGVVKGGRPESEITDDINSLVAQASKKIEQSFGTGAENSVWFYQPELQNVLDEISESNGEMVVRISAAGNLIRGEPVRTSITAYPNKEVYAKNELILSRTFDIQKDDDVEPIIQRFLAEINRLAVEKGILPDPITGTVGAMEVEQMYGLAGHLMELRGGVRLTAYARDKTKSIGPLRLNIEIDKGNQ